MQCSYCIASTSIVWSSTSACPRMGGDELFEIAASVQPHLRQRTIITTGDGSERAHELIAACGCASLGKPFDLRDLLDLTRQLTLRVRDARA